MTDDKGQKSTIWDDWWGGISPVSEIQMWDFYGGRQWITKYAPRYGKVVEAGCGLGRYVFYLRRLGVDIEGIDFSESVIEKLKKIKDEIEPSSLFGKGDVTNLPYLDNSVSGYISLGVIEHFKEGPQKALAEAYRILRPGGIAIITTPNISFLVFYRNTVKKVKFIIKKILGRRIIEEPFFQYEYTPKVLKKFLQDQGFHVSRSESCDLLYPFCEIGNFKGQNLKKGSFAYWFANFFENTWLKRFGAQSVTISIKKAPLMHCFLNGKLLATSDTLGKYDVPLSSEMELSPLANLFIKKKPVKYSCKFEISPAIVNPELRKCELSGEQYYTDKIFEDFGLSKNIAPKLLRYPEISIESSVKYLRPIWRNRVNK